MNTSVPPTDEPREYPYWNRVYLTVILYTIALIFTLWLISKQYQ
jgi:hypothetical protein